MKKTLAVVIFGAALAFSGAAYAVDTPIVSPEPPHPQPIVPGLPIFPPLPVLPGDLHPLPIQFPGGDLGDGHHGRGPK